MSRFRKFLTLVSAAFLNFWKQSHPCLIPTDMERKSTHRLTRIPMWQTDGKQRLDWCFEAGHINTVVVEED